MPRKKRVVEGLVLDLTEIPEGEFDLEALRVNQEEEKRKAIEEQKAKQQAIEEKRKAKQQTREEKQKAIEEKRKAKEETKSFDGDAYIDAVFNSKRKCNHCDSYILFGNICAECCNKLKEENIIQVLDYLEKKGMICCNFCNARCGKDYSGFHFDHLNMFNKSNTIWALVCSTNNINLIYTEIDKCQLLCISCHKLVTKLEQAYGFTRMKIKYTKGGSKRTQSELEEEYNKVMLPIYEKIRGRWRGCEAKIRNFATEM
jgi:hypothetical protein